MTIVLIVFGIAICTLCALQIMNSVKMNRKYKAVSKEIDEIKKTSESLKKLLARNNEPSQTIINRINDLDAQIQKMDKSIMIMNRGFSAPTLGSFVNN